MADPTFASSRDSIVASPRPPLERRHPEHSASARASASDARHAVPAGRRLAVLTLTALGVVYGDIGTSPLYTMKEAFGEAHALAPSAVNVYGVLSLVFWSIVLVVNRGNCRAGDG